jgi:molybdenum cofactor biosynthesis enzyme MoaA
MSRAPSALVLCPTSRCAARCWFCFAEALRKDPRPADLTLALTRKVLELFPTMKPSVYVTGYGEPMMAEEIGPILRLCGTRFGRVSLGTNGYLIAPRAAEVPWQALGNVSLSVNETERGQYAKSCGVDRFQDVLEAIQVVKKHKTPLLMTFVVGQRNVERASEYVRFAAAYGAHIALFAVAYGGAMAESYKTLAEQEVLRVTDHAAVEALRAAADVAKRMRVTVVKWPGLINVNKPYASAAQCKQLRTTLIVDGAGDIATCCRGAGPRAELGNILRDGARAWWSPAAEALRHTRPAKCRFCNI